jgi:hypothetical protein
MKAFYNVKIKKRLKKGRLLKASGQKRLV